MREFLKTRGKSGEAQAKGKCFSHFSSVPKNSQVLKSTMLEEQVFLFFFFKYIVNCMRSH